MALDPAGVDDLTDAVDEVREVYEDSVDDIEDLEDELEGIQDDLKRASEVGAEPVMMSAVIAIDWALSGVF